MGYFLVFSLFLCVFLLRGTCVAFQWGFEKYDHNDVQKAPVRVFLAPEDYARGHVGVVLALKAVSYT